MIHGHLRHFLSEEVVRDDGMGAWGLRSLEKKCEEERLGMYLIDIHIGIYKTLLSLPFFYSSSLWVEKQSINQSINRNQVQQTSKTRYLYLYSS